jgi:hypothetical protein
MPITTRKPNMCNSFSGNPGDPVEWQGVPAGGCTISQAGNNTFPFSPATQGPDGPYITLPTAANITITSSLTSAVYTFEVSCCADHALKTVTVG